MFDFIPTMERVLKRQGSATLDLTVFDALHSHYRRSVIEQEFDAREGNRYDVLSESEEFKQVMLVQRGNGKADREALGEMYYYCATLKDTQYEK